MSLSRIQDLEVIKSEELIERLENQFNLTVPIREFKKPTESVVNKIFINILAHPGFNNELINFQLQPDSHISAVLLTDMVREALRLAEIQDPESVICLRDIYNMQPRITVFRKIVMVLTNFALHVVETLDHLSQYETELQKQTETQEKLYNEVQDLDQKLKEDKEDLEDLKTEFSNVPMKIQNFGTEKENLTDENINMETELEKIDEELKKIKLDNKPILQRKEQLEQELKHMLSEICEDSTLQDMITETEKQIGQYLEKGKKLEEDKKYEKSQISHNETEVQKVESCVQNLNNLKLRKNEQEKFTRNITLQEKQSNKNRQEIGDFDTKKDSILSETSKLKKSLNEDKRNSLLQNRMGEFNKQCEENNQEMEKLSKEVMESTARLDSYKNKIKFLKQEIDGKGKNKSREVKEQARCLLAKEVEDCFKLIREFDEKYKGITFVNKDLVQQVLKVKLRELKTCFEHKN